MSVAEPVLEPNQQPIDGPSPEVRFVHGREGEEEPGDAIRLALTWLQTYPGLAVSQRRKRYSHSVLHKHP